MSQGIASIREECPKMDRARRAKNEKIENTKIQSLFSLSILHQAVKKLKSPSLTNDRNQRYERA
jgi:hypothetical protein